MKTILNRPSNEDKTGSQTGNLHKDLKISEKNQIYTTGPESLKTLILDVDDEEILGLKKLDDKSQANGANMNAMNTLALNSDTNERASTLTEVVDALEIKTFQSEKIDVKQGISSQNSAFRSAVRKMSSPSMGSQMKIGEMKSPKNGTLNFLASSYRPKETSLTVNDQKVYFSKATVGDETGSAEFNSDIPTANTLDKKPSDQISRHAQRKSTITSADVSTNPNQVKRNSWAEKESLASPRGSPSALDKTNRHRLELRSERNSLTGINFDLRILSPTLRKEYIRLDKIKSSNNAASSPRGKPVSEANLATFTNEKQQNLPVSPTRAHSNRLKSLQILTIDTNTSPSETKSPSRELRSPTESLSPTSPKKRAATFRQIAPSAEINLLNDKKLVAESDKAKVLVEIASVEEAYQQLRQQVFCLKDKEHDPQALKKLLSDLKHQMLNLTNSIGN